MSRLLPLSRRQVVVPRGARGPKVLRGNADDMAIIARRCADATKGDPDVVLAHLIYRKSKARDKRIPDVVLDAGSFRALELACMPEMGHGGLQEYVKNRITMANRIHPLRDARPRFQSYHTGDSRMSDEGFPDMIVIDRSFTAAAMYAWELKAEDEQPRQNQIDWLVDFEYIAMLVRALYDTRPTRPMPLIEGRIIRPSDVVYIDRALGLP